MDFGVIIALTMALLGLAVALWRGQRRAMAVQRAALAERDAVLAALMDQTDDRRFILRLGDPRQDGPGSVILHRANAAALALWGVSAQAAEGRRLEAVLPPPLVARMTADLQSALDAGVPTRFEDTTVNQGVTRRWEVWQTPMRDAAGAVTMVAVLARDITDRHDASLAVRAGEQRFRALVDSVTDMVGRLDLTGARLACSERAGDCLGWIPTDLIGQPWTERAHPDDAAALTATLAALSPRAPAATVTYRLRHSEGRWVWIEADLRLVLDDWGAPKECLIVERDITARKVLEAELFDARQAADAASRSKSAFLASLSHELRTPMNAVIGFADLIARESEGPIANPFYREFAHNIRDSGQHLLELINEILDNVRAEAGELVLDDETVDLDRVVSTTVRLLTQRAGRAGVQIVAAVDPQARYLRGDEKRVRQILMNLLSSAMKFTPTGGRIDVGTALDADGGLRLTVRDNGTGAQEWDSGRVVQAFARYDEDAPASGARGGSGLPLTRRLMELHGGSLTLANAPGHGTEAVARFGPERVADEAGRTVAPPPSSRVSLSILMVEDDPTIRDSGVALLRGWGHRVVAASNANEALMILRGATPLDVLFSDIVMPPGMNGAELVREARRLRPTLAVLLASGFAAHAVIADDATQAGYEVIAKPYDPAELQGRLAHFRPLDAAGPSRLPAPNPAIPLPPAPPPRSAFGPRPATLAASNAPDAPLPDGLRVLVAEDVAMNRLLVVTLLTQAGHQVVEVEDGAAAVAAIRQQGFDLVLMDVNMPVMDGLAATQAIRGLDSPASWTPVIALTANTFPEDVARCHAAGMDGYVAKPIDRAVLWAEMARCLSRPAAHSNGPAISRAL